MKIRFEPYKKGDYKKLTGLWEMSGLPYKPKGRDSKESIEKEVLLDCNLYLFALSDEKVVGSILVTHDGRKGWINRVAVLPEHRKRGIARELVKAGEEWLDSKGIYIYACLIEGYNKDSLEAFKKMNYLPFDGIHYLTKRKFPEI
jgi:GNAT superfamily N-acetyltransferase